MRTPLAALTAAILLLPVAACGNDERGSAQPPASVTPDGVFLDGGAGPELGDPLEALKTYLQAVADGDGATACKHLSTERAAEEIGESGAPSCEDAFGEPDESTGRDLDETKNMVITEQDTARAVIQWRYSGNNDDCDEYVLGGETGVWQVQYVFEDQCEYGE